MARLACQTIVSNMGTNVFLKIRVINDIHQKVFSYYNTLYKNVSKTQILKVFLHSIRISFVSMNTAVNLKGIEI